MNYLNIFVLGLYVCLFLKGADSFGVYFDLESFVENALENLPNIKYYAKDALAVDESVREKLFKIQEEYQDSFSGTYNGSPLPTVTVPDLGTARGRIQETFGGSRFYSFQSIPYAEPPVGDMRFQMTEPFKGKWANEMEDDSYDATYLRAKCPQNSLAVPVASGREDCLYVSVYTPTNFTSDSKFAVMFFIHGGSYTSGDASLYLPTKLMDREGIVVVVVQYRLGSLGFVASGTPDAPGNMGLMDQVLALRWVQKNIGYFGGDPDRVTVMGQSAGASSTSWMQLTPQNRAGYPDNNGKQLLNQVLCESGSALEMWTLDTDPEGSFILQANATGCWKGETNSSLECMKVADVNIIVAGYNSVVATSRASGSLGFEGNSPIIQNQEGLIGFPELIVIDKHPLHTIQSGEALKVDVLAGSVRDEGSMVLGLIYDTYMVPAGVSDDPFFLSVEGVPFFVHAFGIEDLTGAVANTMNLEFLKNADSTNFTSMSGGFVDMSGMLFLKTGLWSLVNLLSIYNPNNTIYFYSFEFESSYNSIFDWYFVADPNVPVKGGITHADDLMYLFYLPSLFDARERTQATRHSMLLANFAKYGNPTPEEYSYPEDDWRGETEKWRPFTTESLDFLLIQDNLTMQHDFRLRWNFNTIPDPVEDIQMIGAAETRANYKYNRVIPKRFQEVHCETFLHRYKVATACLGTLCGALLLVLLCVSVDSRKRFYFK